jgi:hypothetical protein
MGSLEFQKAKSACWVVEATKSAFQFGETTKSDGCFGQISPYGHIADKSKRRRHPSFNTPVQSFDLNRR